MSEGDFPQHEAKTAASSLPAEQASPRSASLRAFALWMVLGLVLGAIASLVVLRWQFADSLPTITPADYHAAREQWEASAVPSYDIEVALTGTRGATYRVEVRDGEAKAAWMNGNPLPTQRAFATWSVPGMFGTMSRDIEMLEKHASGKADANTPRLTLRAEFDKKYGYPARYRRIQWGSPVQASWEVTKFEVRPNQ